MIPARESATTYVSVFMALMVLLALTIAASYIHLGRFNWLAALAISIAKALLIVYYFMHLRTSNRLLWVVAGAGCFWLCILVFLSMTDYMTRSWLP
jgi:cytochrome c oxidase subunit 4